METIPVSFIDELIDVSFKVPTIYKKPLSVLRHSFGAAKDTKLWNCLKNGVILPAREKCRAT